MKRYSLKKHGLKALGIAPEEDAPKPTRAPFENKRSVDRLPPPPREPIEPIQNPTPPQPPPSTPPTRPIPEPPFHGKPPRPNSDPDPAPRPDPTPRKDKPVPPRPRTYWNPNAASFGEYDDIWRGLPDTWKAELSGYPMDGVRDLLHIWKMRTDGLRTTGKEPMLRVDNQIMTADQAARTLIDKMRGVAKQIDQQVRDYRYQAQKEAEYKDKMEQRAPFQQRIAPQNF